MKLYQFSFLFTLIIGLSLVLLILKERKPLKTTHQNESQALKIEGAQMRYQLDQQNVNINSQSAFVHSQASKLVFSDGVDIHFEKTSLRPERLTLDPEQEKMLFENLALSGASNVFFHRAEISPKHRMTTAENITIQAPYPLQSFDTLRSIELEKIHTQLKSLQQIQERNKQAKKRQSSTAMFGETSSHEKETDANTPLVSSMGLFKLSSKFVETPLGRFSVRLKFSDISFQVKQQVIRSNFAKFQSGQPFLTFYGQVTLKTPDRELRGDHATLDINTGQLEFDQLSTSFPLQEL